jgi:hypothetical protein
MKMPPDPVTKPGRKRKPCVAALVNNALFISIDLQKKKRFWKGLSRSQISIPS